MCWQAIDNRKGSKHGRVLRDFSMPLEVHAVKADVVGVFGENRCVAIGILFAPCVTELLQEGADGCLIGHGYGRYGKL